MTDPHRRHPIKSILLPILIGLAAAQVLGTLFVRRSNLALLAKVEELAAAGWFTIPTGPAVKPLAAMAPALLGGLFYTLSIGAGMALLTWMLFWLPAQLEGQMPEMVKILLNRLLKLLRIHVFDGRRAFLFSLILTWIMLIAVVNSNGLSLYPTLFVLVVPMATALFMAKSTFSIFSIEHRAKPRWFPFLVLILLTGLWSTQLNKELFIAIRDHVLLSNPVGQSINDFYYRYTLYAAEAFKTFDQKTIKSCVLEGFPEDASLSRLKKVLTRWDILVVADAKSPDLFLSQSGGDLILASSQGQKTVVGETDFVKDPRPWIASYSKENDRYGGFRRLILVGLLIGFPCLLYAIIYTLVRSLLGLLLNDHRAMQLSSILCLLVGLGLFIPMLQGRILPMDANQLKTALENPDWTVRVAALRYIETQKLEIADYPSYRNLLHSPMVVERYWLAHALAVSRDPATYADLLAMMEDPHPNVICQAYYALGRRRHPAAVKSILNKMRTSGHWYTQWYGYRAIRSLGWQQTTSKPTP